MMQRRVNQVAVQAGVLLFFVMAVVGWCCGLQPETCASRALAGAAAVYFVVKLAGKLVIQVLVGALVEDQIRRKQSKEQRG
jgi:hypothetical protein